MLTTPPETSEAVAKFAGHFALSSDPQRLQVKTRSDSEESDCYVDVAKQIEEHGGEIVYGWQVWEWPRILIEGEHHAVWKSENGELMDLSYKADGEEEVVFIPDPQTPYEGKRIRTLRYPLWNHTLVKKLIKASEAIDAEYESGQKSETEFSLNPAIISRLNMEKHRLYQRICSFPRAKKKA